jgi:hypothetical protein
MSYSLEWAPGAVVVGALGLLWVPSIALIVLAVVALAAVAALVALAGAVVAAPFLLGRALSRRWQARHPAQDRETRVLRPAFRPGRRARSSAARPDAL